MRTRQADENRDPDVEVDPEGLVTQYIRISFLAAASALGRFGSSKAPVRGTVPTGVPRSLDRTSMQCCLHTTGASSIVLNGVHTVAWCRSVDGCPTDVQCAHHYVLARGAIGLFALVYRERLRLCLYSFAWFQCCSNLSTFSATLCAVAESIYLAQSSV